MAHKPLIDPHEINRIVAQANADRVRYLRDRVISGVGTARWSGLAALAASFFAIFASHGTAGAQDAAGGKTNQTINRAH